MFFVVDRPRLQRIIAITRDDRRKRQQGKDAPFFRIEANDGHLKITGRAVEADFPATVYEPGVLFLRVTLFRRALQALTGMKELAIQVNNYGMFLDNIRLSLKVGDMLLYVDPAKAPMRRPDESAAGEYPHYDGNTLREETLFKGALEPAIPSEPPMKPHMKVERRVETDKAGMSQLVERCTRPDANGRSDWLLLRKSRPLLPRELPEVAMADSFAFSEAAQHGEKTHETFKGPPGLGGFSTYSATFADGSSWYESYARPGDGYSQR